MVVFELGYSAAAGQQRGLGLEVLARQRALI
jgi:hypothetical protein